MHEFWRKQTKKRKSPWRVCVVDGSQLILDQLPLPYKTRMPRAILPSVTSSFSPLFLFSGQTSDLTYISSFSIQLSVDNSTAYLFNPLTSIYTLLLPSWFPRKQLPPPARPRRPPATLPTAVCFYWSCFTTISRHSDFGIVMVANICWFISYRYD